MLGPLQARQPKPRSTRRCLEVIAKACALIVLALLAFVYFYEKAPSDSQLKVAVCFVLAALVSLGTVVGSMRWLKAQARAGRRPLQNQNRFIMGFSAVFLVVVLLISMISPYPARGACYAGIVVGFGAAWGGAYVKFFWAWRSSRSAAS